MIVNIPRGEPIGLFSLLGRFSVFLGLFFLLSVGVGVLFGEYGTAIRIAIAALGSILLGLILQKAPPPEEEVSLPGAFTLATLVWIHATLMTGLAYWNTGFFLSFLDACFDAMSGYTTTGLTLLQDLDHAPEALQFLRHAVTFLGGQGIIVLFLVFATQGASAFFQLYVGEGKDERLWPNVLHTARTIWGISMVYLIIGTGALYPLLRSLGLEPTRALFEALYLFESTWSTGGFAPHTQNLLYYHSGWVELVTAVIFVLGSLNFAVHHQVTHGNIAEMWKNSEVRSFVCTLLLLTLGATWLCASAQVYPTFITSFRKVFFQMVSAHTTTGNMTLYARQFIHDWPVPAVFCVIVAMVIGGSACSTAGGIKGMRLSQMVYALRFELRRILQPPHAVSTLKMHHRRPLLFTPELGYKALLIAGLYIVLIGGTTMAGLCLGFPLLDAFFEGVSASTNSGLSCGVTTAAMPAVLKGIYILAMFLGRLEYMAVFTLVGYGFGIMRMRNL